MEFWREEIARDEGQISHRARPPVILESRLEEIARDIKRAQQEFQAGHCQPVTPKELIEEL